MESPAAARANGTHVQGARRCAPPHCGCNLLGCWLRDLGRNLATVSSVLIACPLKGLQSVSIWTKNSVLTACLLQGSGLSPTAQLSGTEQLDTAAVLYWLADVSISLHRKSPLSFLDSSCQESPPALHCALCVMLGNCLM